MKNTDLENATHRTHAMATSAYTQRELGHLSKEALRAIADEAGLPHSGTKDALRTRILAGRSSIDSNLLKAQGAADEKIINIISKKKALAKKKSAPSSKKTFTTALKLTNQEMDDKNCELVNVATKDGGKIFTYKNVSKNGKANLKKKTCKPNKGITLREIKNRFRQRDAATCIRIVKAMDGNHRAKDLGEEFIRLITEDESSCDEDSSSDSETLSSESDTDEDSE